MIKWNAQAFYNDNKDMPSAFTLRAGHGRTEIDSHLSDALRQIVNKNLGNVELLAVVKTANGEIGLSSEQYQDLLRIQKEADATEASSN